MLIERSTRCYYSNGRYYCRRNRWSTVGRWILLGVVIFVFLVGLFLLLCCLRRRRSRTRGAGAGAATKPSIFNRFGGKSPNAQQQPAGPQYGYYAPEGGNYTAQNPYGSAPAQQYDAPQYGSAAPNQYGNMPQQAAPTYAPPGQTQGTVHGQSHV